MTPTSDPQEPVTAEAGQAMDGPTVRKIDAPEVYQWTVIPSDGWLYHLPTSLVEAIRRTALAAARPDAALREALVATLRAYHIVAFDYGHNHPIEQCDQPMVKKRLALAAALADVRPDAALREAAVAYRDAFIAVTLTPHFSTQAAGVTRLREALFDVLAAASPDSAPAGLDALASVPEHAGAWGEPDESYEKGWNDCREAFAARLRATPASTTGPAHEAGK